VRDKLLEKKISIRNSEQPGKDYFLFFYNDKNQSANGEHLTKEELKFLGKEIRDVFTRLGESLS
jgi:hypothetical protein